jgi:hypothetical protein
MSDPRTPRSFVERHRFGRVERIPARRRFRRATSTPISSSRVLWRSSRRAAWSGRGPWSVRPEEGQPVWVAKQSELIGSSPRGFERAHKTLRNITGLQVLEEKARVEEGKITEFLVTLQVIFILEDPDA